MTTATATFLLRFPAITRLREQHRMALPWVLDQLESYACYEVGCKMIPATGCIRLFGRNASLGAVLANVEVTFWESLTGLEARVNGQCVVVLREYRTFKQMAVYRWKQLPQVLSFEPYEQAICPRIAVAQ
jgi:hypothetical protein